MGSEAGGKSAVNAYTLIETAKMNKVNPEAWLAWVLERIQDHPANRINDLMPWAYQDMIKVFALGTSSRNFFCLRSEYNSSATSAATMREVSLVDLTMYFAVDLFQIRAYQYGEAPTL